MNSKAKETFTTPNSAKEEPRKTIANSMERCDSVETSHTLEAFTTSTAKDSDETADAPYTNESFTTSSSAWSFENAASSRLNDETSAQEKIENNVAEGIVSDESSRAALSKFGTCEYETPSQSEHEGENGESESSENDNESSSEISDELIKSMEMANALHSNLVQISGSEKSEKPRRQNASTKRRPTLDSVAVTTTTLCPAPNEKVKNLPCKKMTETQTDT